MKIIIVDDEKAVHFILNKMLSKIPGIESVRSFSDAASALSHIQANEVDLAFVDIGMPEESGLDLVRKINESGADIDVVFVTSHKEYALEAFGLYATDYIVKPVNRDRLETTVRRVFNRRFAMHKRKLRPVEILCLGGIVIRSEQAGISKWKTRKSAELFAYLLLHRGRLVSRAKILDDLFGDGTLKDPDGYLSTVTYQLREELGRHGLRSCVVSNHEEIGLLLEHVYIDFVEFERCVKLLEHIDEHHLDTAVQVAEMYKGDLFGGRGFVWAWNEIERLQRVYISFGTRLAEAWLRKGDLSSAVSLLKKLLSYNELDEDANLAILKVYAAQNNHAALTEHYRRFRELYISEFGTEPFAGWADRLPDGLPVPPVAGPRSE